MSAEDVIAKVILALCSSASSMLQGVVVPAGPGEVHHSQADLQPWHRLFPPPCCLHVPTDAYACSAKPSEEHDAPVRLLKGPGSVMAHRI